MLLDFRANRIVLIASLALAALLLGLFLMQGAPWPQILLLFTFFGLFITFNLRRMALRAMRQLEYRLMVQLDAEHYQEAYLAMLEKGVKYNPRWHLTKYQRAILGTLLTGDATLAHQLRQQQNEKFKGLIDDDPYFLYLNQVTLAIEAILFGTRGEMNKAFAKEKEVLNKLNPKFQDQIQQNPHSFSNVFNVLKETNETEAFASLESTITEWTPFMRIITLAYLSRWEETFVTSLKEEQKHMLNAFTPKAL